MKTFPSPGKLPEELVLAIGLIWGHLNTRQFDHAWTLAQGCLLLWPDEPQLRLLAAYAAVETGHPLDEATMALLGKEENKPWAERILRRAQTNRTFPENAQ